MPIQIRVLLCLVLVSAWGLIAETGWCLLGSRLHGQDVRSGAARLVDVGAVLGLQLASSTACWADFNKDGWSDLVAGGVVWRNEKGERFTKLSEGFGEVVASDYDNDGWCDLFSYSQLKLYRNVQGASFEVVGMPELPKTVSLGACWGDFDADGHIDLFVGNFAHVDGRGDQPKSRFLRNMAEGAPVRFEDRGICGVFYQESYANPSAGDVDNDGDLDLFFTTVYESASFGVRNEPTLFEQRGMWDFVNSNASAGLSGLGATYQAAWADYDRDGDLDLVTAGKLFRNDGQGLGHWLSIQLVGDGEKVSRTAVGAQVRVRVGDRVLVRQVEAGTGQGNQNDLVLHFGLGGNSGVVEIEIDWPDGVRQRLEKLEVDQFHRIERKGEG